MRGVLIIINGEGLPLGFDYPAELVNALLWYLFRYSADETEHYRVGSDAYGADMNDLRETEAPFGFYR
jgi:hypothetical protein